jgi:hypothetical protein
MKNSSPDQRARMVIALHFPYLYARRRTTVKMAIGTRVRRHIEHRLMGVLLLPMMLPVYDLRSDPMQLGTPPPAHSAPARASSTAPTKSMLSRSGSRALADSQQVIRMARLIFGTEAFIREAICSELTRDRHRFLKDVKKDPAVQSQPTPAQHSHG